MDKYDFKGLCVKKYQQKMNKLTILRDVRDGSFMYPLLFILYYVNVTNV